MTISIFCAGGTFEKIYETGLGVKNFSFPLVSVVGSILERIGLTDIELFYEQSKAKDSLDMTTEDRIFVARWCAHPSRSCCVVVHGTDTMIETAKVINQFCANKTVVLTGASKPALYTGSDAEFNLGGALIAAQFCKPGVYIVMNGSIFHFDGCMKNSSGHFETL